MRVRIHWRLFALELIRLECADELPFGDLHFLEVSGLDLLHKVAVRHLTRLGPDKHRV